MAHPGGRPTDYDPDFNYIQAAYKYLKTCGREQTKLPKLLEFYEILDISPQTADTWKDKYPQFLEACKKIEGEQENQLMDDGLYGGKEVNPGMAIFLLKCNHGKMETDKHVLDASVKAEVKVKYEFEDVKKQEVKPENGN